MPMRGFVVFKIMFSIDNFYDYLSHCYSWPKKDNIIYKFNHADIRNLIDMPSINNNVNSIFSQGLERYYGGIYLFDQEPFQLEQYHYNGYADTSPIYYKTPFDFDNVVYRLSSMPRTIICHSEKNSKDIDRFVDRGFVDVHYFYHAFISRDWFRHWKHYHPETNEHKHRFGCYIRDTKGTREYRKQLLNDPNIYFPNSQVSSDESARITWSDTGRFDIHVVAETLFNTEKTHLTEKIFKPIVMRQPFILFAGPGSLRYLRDYGFKTFGDLWNEEYDDIHDNQERFNQASKMIARINKLPESKYKDLLNQAQAIVDYNHRHFFSQKFEDQLLNELHQGFESALNRKYDAVITNPGGVWFEELNRLYKQGYKQYFNKFAITHCISQLPQNSQRVLVNQYPWVDSLQ